MGTSQTAAKIAAPAPRGPGAELPVAPFGHGPVPVRFPPYRKLRPQARLLSTWALVRRAVPRRKIPPHPAMCAEAPSRFRPRQRRSACSSNFREISVRMVSPALKCELPPGRLHHLVAQADKVHLDAAFGLVPARLMGEGRQVEISAKLAIDAPQEIEVERRRHPACIVIGRHQYIRRLASGRPPAGSAHRGPAPGAPRSGR